MSTEAKSSDRLLRTKLYRPTSRGGLVSRHRLHERLNTGLQTPLTLVTAPAGYGKSVAVRHWLQSLDTPSAWLSLDETNSDTAELLRYLVAAVRTLFPAACPQTEALVGARQPVPLAEPSACLLNELDDYHRLGSKSDVHRVIDHLLAHPPRSLRLVIISRQNPPLSFSALRVSGQLTELSEKHLRFTDEESSELLTALVYSNACALLR